MAKKGTGSSAMRSQSLPVSSMRTNNNHSNHSNHSPRGPSSPREGRRETSRISQVDERFLQTISTIDDLMTADKPVDEDATSEAEEAHWLIGSRWFTAIIFVTILVNSIQMGLAVDMPES